MTTTADDLMDLGFYRVDGSMLFGCTDCGHVLWFEATNLMDTAREHREVHRG